MRSSLSTSTAQGVGICHGGASPALPVQLRTEPNRVLLASEFLAPEHPLSHRGRAAAFIRDNAREIEFFPPYASRAVFGSHAESESEMVCDLLDAGTRNPALWEHVIPLAAYALRDHRAAVRNGSYSTVVQLGAAAAPLVVPLIATLSEGTALQPSAQGLAALAELRTHAECEVEHAERAVRWFQNLNRLEVCSALNRDQNAIATTEFDLPDEAYYRALVGLTLGCREIRHFALTNLHGLQTSLQRSGLQAVEAAIAFSLRQFESSQGPGEIVFLELTQYCASANSPIAEWLGLQEVQSYPGVQLRRDVCALEIAPSRPPSAVMERLGAEILEATDGRRHSALHIISGLAHRIPEAARERLVSGMLDELERGGSENGEQDRVMQFLPSINGYQAHLMRWCERRCDSPLNEDAAALVASVSFFASCGSVELSRGALGILRRIEPSIGAAFRSNFRSYILFLEQDSGLPLAE